MTSIITNFQTFEWQRAHVVRCKRMQNAHHLNFVDCLLTGEHHHLGNCVAYFAPPRLSALHHCVYTLTIPTSISLNNLLKFTMNVRVFYNKWCGGLVTYDMKLFEKSSSFPLFHSSLSKITYNLLLYTLTVEFCTVFNIQYIASVILLCRRGSLGVRAKKDFR